VTGRVEVIGLDGDDTLWHNETFFAVTHDRFVELLADHADPASLGQRLDEVQRQNLALYGYGAKAFTLSMIETAIEITGATLPVAHVQAILELGRGLLSHPVELLDGVREALEQLGDRRLVLVTKGDLFHQDAKVAGSGLGELFERVEIVSEKDEPTYRRVTAALGISPDAFVMVGNSLRSDVVPVVGIGGRAVHVPYAIEWDHEAVPERELPLAGWWRLDSLRGLPDLVARIEA
jgi:putative hydrolase of the HAD superfamily